MTTPHEFGARLKAMRERRGIPLEAIAGASKIALPLLAALERDDVSRWPKGIFRRAFFRDYAAAIGAPVDDMLAEFLRIFPEEGGPAAEPSEMRMTLAPLPAQRRRHAIRTAAALAEAAVVLVVGAAIAWAAAWDVATVLAVLGLVYYPVTSAWLGRSLAQAWLQEGRQTLRTWQAERRIANVEAMAESAREEWAAAGLPRDRRTGVDRRRVPRVLHNADPAPLESLFGLRKGSAA
jgi:transcriptional regulator with XRE-family HTH domain